MSNEEVICTFMEAKPARTKGCSTQHQSNLRTLRWWIPVAEGTMFRWVPRQLTLDALHEVEAKLSAEQWNQYIDLLLGKKMYRFRKILDYADVTAWVHASAEQKIQALGEVLGREVERQ